MGLRSVLNACLCCSSVVTLCPAPCRLPPMDVILSKLIPHGLPTGSSSPSTAPQIQLCTTGAHSSGTAPAQVPMDRSSPSSAAPLSGCFPWAAALAQGCSGGALCGLYLHQITSSAASWAPPWLHVEVCSAWCRKTVCSSMGLSRAAGSCCSALLLH